MKNTEILLWIEPLVMNHKRCNDRIHFICVVDGDQTKSTTDELDAILDGKIMESIMEFACIDSNWNYGARSAKLTKKNVGTIEIVDSPEEVIQKKKDAVLKKKAEKAISKLITSNEDLVLEKDNVQILEKGMLEVSLPSLLIKQKIDFSKIWDSIEKNILGKINVGDTFVLEDEHGNEIFEIRGGNFLNIGLSDLKVYDAKKAPKNRTIFNEAEGLKGGMFVRRDGTLDIGDHDRTFYISINTGNLLKLSLKTKKSINDIVAIKLLKP